MTGSAKRKGDVLASCRPDRLEAWADDLEQQQLSDNNQAKDTTT